MPTYRPIFAKTQERLNKAQSKLFRAFAPPVDHEANAKALEDYLRPETPPVPVGSEAGPGPGGTSPEVPRDAGAITRPLEESAKRFVTGLNEDQTITDVFGLKIPRAVGQLLPPKSAVDALGVVGEAARTVGAPLGALLAVPGSEHERNLMRTTGKGGTIFQRAGQLRQLQEQRPLGEQIVTEAFTDPTNLIPFAGGAKVGARVGKAIAEQAPDIARATGRTLAEVAANQEGRVGKLVPFKSGTKVRILSDAEVAQAEAIRSAKIAEIQNAVDTARTKGVKEESIQKINTMLEKLIQVSNADWWLPKRGWSVQSLLKEADALSPPSPRIPVQAVSVNQPAPAAGAQVAQGQAELPKAVAKQRNLNAWEMTRDAYARQMSEQSASSGSVVRSNNRGQNNPETYMAWWEQRHRDQVGAALSEGKPVPPEVLADYPDLAPKAVAPSAAPSAFAASRFGITKLYHETDINNALRILTGNGDLSGLQVTPAKDLALGQKGKGVVVEFGNAGAMEVRPLRTKPSAAIVEQQLGAPSELEILKGMSGEQPITSITLKPNTSLSMLNRKQLKDLVSQGWTHSKLPDGATRFEAPSAAPKQPSASPTALTAGEAAPAPQAPSPTAAAGPAASPPAGPAAPVAQATGAPPRVPPATPAGTPPQGPTVPPTATGAGGAGRRFDDVLNRMGQEPPGPPLGKRIQQAATKFEEQALDDFAVLNKVGERFKNVWRRANPNQPVPLEFQVETQLALSRGAPAAGARRVRDFADAVNAASGKPFKDMDRFTNLYLRLKHNLDIIAVKGGGRKIAGGVQGETEARQLLAEMEARIGPDKTAQIQRAAGAVTSELRKVTLDRVVAEGIITPDTAATLKRLYPNYTPTKYVELIEDLLTAQQAPTGGLRRISVTSSDIRKLGDVGLEAEAFAPIDAAVSQIIRTETLIARNRGARALGKTLLELGEAKRVPTPKGGYRDVPGTISYMDGGERVVLKVDPEVERVAKFIWKSTDPEGISRVAAQANQIFKTAFVQYNPVFLVNNIRRDLLTAIFTEQVSLAREAQQIGAAIRASFGGKQSPVAAQMLRQGGGMSGIYADTPALVARKAAEQGAHVLDSTGALRRALQNPAKLIWDLTFGTVRRVGEGVESGTRAAIFQTKAERSGVRFVGQNITSGPGVDMERVLAEAALAGRRGTVDFGRAGTIGRQLNNFFIFLNPAIQGVSLVPRALRANPRSRIVAGALAGSAVALYAWNSQYPEYADIPPDVRIGSIILMLPSVRQEPRTGKPIPNYIVFVPNSRELAIFTGSVTAALEQMQGVPTADVSKAVSQIAGQSSPFEQSARGVTDLAASALTGRPISAETQRGAVSELIPTEILSNLVEQAFNRDTFRGRPIVPPELESKPPAEQYNEFTPRAIVRLGQALNVSPLRLNHAFAESFGSLGRESLKVVDKVLEVVAPEARDPKVEQGVAGLRSIGPESVRRSEFLARFDPETQQQILGREAYLVAQERPGGAIPFVSGLIVSVVGNRGGEMYRVGLERAQEQTGVSPEQTRKALSEMGVFMDELSKDALRDYGRVGKPDGIIVKDWKERESTRGKQTGGFMEGLGALYPKSPYGFANNSERAAYYDSVKTIAGAIPDTRDRAQVLAAAYRSIDLPEDPATGEKDFATLYEARDQFRKALSAQDNALLDSARRANMNPLQRAEDEAQDKLRPYWEAAKTARMSGAALDQYREWEMAPSIVKREIERRPMFKAAQKLVTQERQRMRAKDAEVDLAVTMLYGNGEAFANRENIRASKEGTLTFGGVNVSSPNARMLGWATTLSAPSGFARPEFARPEFARPVFVRP